MRTNILIIVSLVLNSVCHSQINHSEDWLNSGWQYANESDSMVDVSTKIITNNDLTYLLKYPYPQYREDRKIIPSYGLLGDDFSKVEILFTEISKNKSDVSSYDITGDIKLDHNINKLKGTITFKRATAYIQQDNTEPTTVALIGSYILNETSNAKKIATHSGSVKIILFTKDVFAKNVSFDMNSWYEEGAIKGFVGVRKTNKNSISQSEIWDFPRFPHEYAKDFDLGFGEEMINIKYAKSWFDFSEEEWNNILKQKPVHMPTATEEYIERNELDWYRPNKLTQTDLQKSVQKQLKLSTTKIAQEFIAIKEFNNYLNETIVVIPEIENDICGQEELYYELTSHILIVNSLTGKIKYHFTESSELNGWISDAIAIDQIIIDSTNYPINKTENAFSITTYYSSSSQPNPYRSTSRSLYIKENGDLKKIIDAVVVDESIGIVNVSGDCYGEFEIQKTKILIDEENSTYGYYDIILDQTDSKTVFELNTEDECKEKQVKNIKSYESIKYNNSDHKYTR